jgi:hypothetical protein
MDPGFALQLYQTRKNLFTNTKNVKKRKDPFFFVTQHGAEFRISGSDLNLPFSSGYMDTWTHGLGWVFCIYMRMLVGTNSMSDYWSTAAC